MDNVQTLAEQIKMANTICVFSGAGMSTESGIPDFRSSGGLYDGEEIESYVSSTYFRKHPEDFWKKFKEIFKLKLMGGFEPNTGHLFLKELEEMGKTVHILTQNIDGLHERAGNTSILELHGTLQHATCSTCKGKYDLKHINASEIPRCVFDHDILKPDVVLFGDMVDGYNEAITRAYNSDLFIVLGTSLEVYPVNQIPAFLSRAPKIHKAIINKTATKMDAFFHTVIHDGIGNTVQKLRENLNC